MRATVVILFVCLTVACAYPQKNPAEIVLLESETGEKNYNFKYETSDGVARSEEGTLKDSGNPDDPTLLSVQGAYAYTDDLGNEHKVSYIADENGFRVLPGST